MTEKEIQEYHSTLFNYLYGVHQQNPSFMFRVRRMNNQNRLGNGYWFNGNAGYLETSFWDYKDNLHQTSVIRLVYFFGTKVWICELVGRDNKEREGYFRNMVNTKEFSDYIIDGRTPIWRKNLVTPNFLDAIKSFVEREKYKIDKYIESTPLPHLINFIQKIDFEKDIRRIEQTKHNVQKVDANEIQSKASKIPYSLNYISIENFTAISSLVLGKYENDGEGTQIPIDTQWIFLTGENGFGKTLILSAIASALTNGENFPSNIPEFTGFKNGKYYSNRLEDIEDAKLEDTKKDIEKVVAYGVSRLLTEETTKDTGNRTASLFSDKAMLLSIEDVLKKNDLRFKELSEKIKSILPNIAEIEKHIDKNGFPEIFFYEKDNADNTYKDAVTVEKLGTGYKGIFNMIGDILLRLSGNLSKKIHDIEGIVIIDEFDANLHPKYQYELPNLLSKAFPKVQFIVSTHSPIPLLGLPKDVKTAIFKVNRTVEDGITVNKLDDDIPFRQMLPNSLLSSPIFGFETIFSRDEAPTNIITEDNWDEIEDVREIQQEILNLKKKGLL